MSKTNILIVGVGGQGTLLASRVLGNYAMLKNMDCKLSEVHGMAQRGGSVVTHFIMAEKVYSSVIAEGEADVLLSFEKLEAARYVHFLKSDGKVIYNEQEIMPQPVVTGQTKYPTDIQEKLKEKTQNVESFDAMKIANELGNVKCINTIMLARLCKSMNFDYELFKQALINSVPPKFLQLNLQALEKAYRG